MDTVNILRFINSLILILILSSSGYSQNEVEQKDGQFDFWIGEWDVFKYGTDTLAGYSQIESILNGVVIKESYQSVIGGYEGTSLNKYNSINQKWEQYWVDNSGITLHLVGEYGDNKMTLANKEERSNSTLYNRITWTDLDGEAVRQKWEQSRDGQNWQVAFDGHYKPKKK